ncbi:sulfite reductase subunit beta [Pholiota molesta]|nr:sulfite reductase subunit beta [Pholiota molesta]
MASSLGSVSAVARVAYLTSDVVIDSLPPPPSFSKFSQKYSTLSRTSVHKPTVISSPFGADSGSTILRNTTNLTSFTASASSHELSALPVVFHLAVQDDLSDVLLLRAAVPFFLVSTTSQQAHDNALLAARLARLERKAVVHVFYEGTFPLVGQAPDVSTIGISGRVTPVNGVNGHTNGHASNGHTNEDDQGAAPLRPLVPRGSPEPHTVIFTLGKTDFDLFVEGVLFVSLSLANPLPHSRLLQQVFRWHSRWTPIYLDIVTALQQRSSEQELVIQSGILGNSSNVQVSDIMNLIEKSALAPTARLLLGQIETPSSAADSIPHVPKHEAAYTKILAHLFNERLEIENSPSLVASQGEIATTPEYALGRLVNSVQALLEDADLDSELHELLTKWALGKSIVESLESTPVDHPSVKRILALQEFFPTRSRWIIGSDAWSYDLGASGLHHAIASRLNINILILDTLPYSSRNNVDPHRRKHDAGLYAMNHGDVFVASVAADRFDGPSVVLAYLPYQSEDASALDILKETKLAVDSGYWPLYRWDPSKEKDGKEPFSLDSDAIKNDLKQFLDRQNHLSQLVRSTPKMVAELVGRCLQLLLNSLDAPPLLILYASDAKRLENRAKLRGLSTTIATLDSYTLEALGEEEHVVFITSTAGQGEPPQNGRTFFKTLNAAAARGDQLLGKVRYSDAHYYNKPGKDLDARLEKLGAERIVDLGLGDDQDADGSETGYKVWEPLIWKALGVDSVEHIKAASGYLRGTISEGLQDFSTGALAPSDGQLTKFHGIYQQDDRDIREEREAQGVEPAYSFMIRVRMPGGVCSPGQWLDMDQIADEHGNGTFKITTRQTFQFHGVIKRHLKPAIQEINRALLDTLLLAVMCTDRNGLETSSVFHPTMSKLHEQVYQFAKEVSNHLIPRTTAYHEIWLDKKLVAGEALKDFEPLYGEFYLPRKVLDVFANDLGFIAIVGEDGELQGFNVTIGGGMETYPRLGSIIGFCTPEQGKYVAEKVMLVQRDNGNALSGRKNARLKYTVDRMGLDKLLGYPLQAARAYAFDRNVDDFGWHTGADGKHHFTMFVENGRIADEPGKDFKTGLREIAKVHKGTFRLTANQHSWCRISRTSPGRDQDAAGKFRMDNLEFSGLRLSSSACVAFPTCGLAMASLRGMTGCPKAALVHTLLVCPTSLISSYHLLILFSEVAFVGKAPGNYSMLLGEAITASSRNPRHPKPMIKRYALERLEGERFGDFTIRAGYIAPTTEGRLWYEHAGGAGENKELRLWRSPPLPEGIYIQSHANIEQKGFGIMCNIIFNEKNANGTCILRDPDLKKAEK